MGKALNLHGQRFGRLSVVAGAERLRNGERLWLCHCDCGREVEVSGSAMKRGNTLSCGCIKAEKARAIGLAKKTHGQRGTRPTPEYRAWSGILDRTTNPKSAHWADYGGRGITVCPEWRTDFSAFFAHIGRRPSSAHSVDRIDNDRGYEPGNVRWATPIEQARNRRVPQQPRKPQEREVVREDPAGL